MAVPLMREIENKFRKLKWGAPLLHFFSSSLWHYPVRLIQTTIIYYQRPVLGLSRYMACLAVVLDCLDWDGTIYLQQQQPATKLQRLCLCPDHLVSDQ